MNPNRRTTNYTLVIEELPAECTETDLIKLVKPLGKLSVVNIFRHHTSLSQQQFVPTPRYGTVTAALEFQLKEHAETVRNYLLGTILWGRQLKYVSF